MIRTVPTKRTGMMQKRLRHTILGRSKPSADGRKERPRAEKVPWQTALLMRAPKRPETLNVNWPETRILPNYGFGTWHFIFLYQIFLLHALLQRRPWNASSSVKRKRNLKCVDDHSSNS
jgi:hypothetical protein